MPLLIACSDVSLQPVCGARHALGTEIAVTTTEDELEADGDCSLREAMRAADLNVPVDACPAGAPAPQQDVIRLAKGRYVAAIAGAGDDEGLTGDYDVNGPVSVLGDCADGEYPVIDMAGLDRAFHVRGGDPEGLFELACLEIRGACTNGGDCLDDVPGSIPAGAAFYHNSVMTLRARDLRITGNAAREGGGFAVCNIEPLDALVERVEVTGNVSQTGGAIDAHVDWTLRDAVVKDNVTRGSGLGAGLRQYDRHARVIDSVFENNVSAGAGGGIAAVGDFQAAAAGSISMLRGALIGNRAGAGGGNAYVNGGLGGMLLFSAPCGEPGCWIELDSVQVVDGVADDPAAHPPGSGGNLEANTTGATHGRIDLRGTTAVSGGHDGSEPAAPDCASALPQAVRLYDGASLSDATGCRFEDHRAAPTCPDCADAASSTPVPDAGAGARADAGAEPAPPSRSDPALAGRLVAGQRLDSEAAAAPRADADDCERVPQ